MNIVIVGSGFAGFTLAEKLKASAPNFSITLITCEHDGFYSRPLLSHGFSKADSERAIVLKPFSALTQQGIELFSPAEVSRIDRSGKQITVVSDGRDIVLDYDKLVLAQGSAAFVPPPFRANSDCFDVLNSLADLKRLRKLRQTLLVRGRPQWAVIGGGLIGCEVASDLAKAGDEVTLYHAMDRLMERQLLEHDSIKLHAVLEANGIKVLLQQSVTGFSKQNDKIQVDSDMTGEFDAVLVACGFKPRIDLAAAAGLAVNRGIIVTPYLATSDPDIFALGDVAELPDGKLYAFILPIRSQAQWLADYLVDGSDKAPWRPPTFKPKAKVHGFLADEPLPF